MMVDSLVRRRRFFLGPLSMLMLGAVLAAVWHPSTVDAKEPRGTLTIAVATMANSEAPRAVSRRTG